MGVWGSTGTRAGGVGITPGSVARYALTPQLGPRFAALFARGFAYIPYYIAVLYQAVGLLPAGHPYTLGANIGRFGVRHAVAEAANHLVLDWRRADQIVLFVASLAGIALAAAQILLLPLALAMAIAPAAAWGFSDLVTPNPQQDLAFILLDLTFGVPDIFDSCIATGVPCQDAGGQFVLTGFGGFPHPIHYALHALLATYSTGLLVVAVLITCYFVTAIVVETAQTGTPMGKRFNQSWGVLRLLVAIGLLWPGGFGLNAAQYIVLYAAKFGSGLATNGWLIFLEEMESSAQAQNLSLIGTPNIPELDDLVRFYHVAATCREAYGVAGQDIRPYLVRSTLVPPHNLEMTSTDYEGMVNFLQGGNRAFIRFGTPDEQKGVFSKGYVKPTCGEIAFTLTDPRDPKSANPPDRGPYFLQYMYWGMLQDLWTEQAKAPNYPLGTVKHYMSGAIHDTSAPRLTQERKASLLETYGTYARDGLAKAIEEQIKAYDQHKFQGFKDKGWAFAGVLYDHIASMGGPVATAAYNLPTPAHYPALMEEICGARHALDARGPQNVECFNPDATKDRGFQDSGLTGTEREIGSALYHATRDDWGSDSAPTRRHAADGVAEFFYMLFGADGLFDMRENQGVHPLAQLTMVGRSLVEAAVRNIGWALFGGGAISGTLATLLGPNFVSGGLGSISGFLLTIATVALTLGFLLFYIMPFLPFIYFFFGVGGWLKAVFEAMVGTPLWALAHLRIDGEGLTGDAAKNGYFLILEIFLRPIFLVFGLIAGISIFTAMVMGLNAVFDLAVTNLVGFSETDKLGDPGFTDVEFYRGYVDQFFFTVVYVIIVYMIGMASFKMIDLIPQQILRWMGVSVTPFTDGDQNPAEGMMQYAQMGGQQAIGSVTGGLQSLVGKLSRTA